MDQYQQQRIAEAMAGMGAFLLLVGLLITVFLIFCFWRIFAKAGLAGPLALLGLIPFFGWLVVLCVAAFARWNVIPAAPPYGTLPPNYPPPNYPPYPPAPPNPPQHL